VKKLGCVITRTAIGGPAMQGAVSGTCGREEVGLCHYAHCHRGANNAGSSVWHLRA